MKSKEELAPQARIALCLYGRFNNRHDRDSGVNGFSYIRSILLDAFEVDVFIYSTDIEHAEAIDDLYSPWLKAKSFEAQLDFPQILKENEISESNFQAQEGFRTLSNTLAFLYGRGQAINLASEYARTNGIEYATVVASRFDLGQLDKVNGSHSHRVSEMGFNPLMDMNFIYSAQWNQHDAGYADQWFYSSMQNMTMLANMYERVLGYFKGVGGYFEFLSDGVLDSNARSEFANVRLRNTEQATPLKKYDLSQAVNNHLLHKYFFLEAGLYDRSKFTSDFGEIANVLYTHSDYSDVWPAFFTQQDKFLGPFKKNYIFLNKFSELVPRHWEQIFYDDSSSYTDRLDQCFSQIRSELIFFQHEDMFLYDLPKVAPILKISAKMKNPKTSLDYIRLIRGGLYLGFPIIGNPAFSRMSRISPWLFSIQPSLWRRESFLTLIRSLPGRNIWEFEIQAQKKFRALKIRGATLNQRGQKRGKHHWDSKLYPFVATAIVKGKWNFSEYEDVLAPILGESSIDHLVRGIT